MTSIWAVVCPFICTANRLLNYVRMSWSGMASSSSSSPSFDPLPLRRRQEDGLVVDFDCPVCTEQYSSAPGKYPVLFGCTNGHGSLRSHPPSYNTSISLVCASKRVSGLGVLLRTEQSHLALTLGGMFPSLSPIAFSPLPSHSSSEAGMRVHQRSHID